METVVYFYAYILTSEANKMKDRLLIFRWWRLVKRKKRRRNLAYYGTFEVGNILEDRYLNPLKSGPSVL